MVAHRPPRGAEHGRPLRRGDGRPHPGPPPRESALTPLSCERLRRARILLASIGERRPRESAILRATIASAASILSLVLLVGCSSSETQDEGATTSAVAATSGAPVAPSAAPSSPAPVNPAITGVGIARALERKIPAVRKIIRITADNDSDNLLGKPDGYGSAAVVLDKRVDCGVKGIGVSCGALVEVWPTAQGAIDRLQSLQTVDTKAAVTERDYARGNVLVRVTGSLSAAQALTYRGVLEVQVAG